MVSRYIPVKIRRAIREKFTFRSGVKCGFPGCRKPAMDFHHTKRFAIAKRHAEEEIVPLCKIHHELAHAGLIGNEDEEISTWHLKEEGEQLGSIAEIDREVRRKKFAKR